MFKGDKLITFSNWITLREATASDDALLKYYKQIEQNPNLSDIKTILSMMKQTRNQRMSEVIPLILRDLKKIIFRVPREEQEEALEEINDAEREIIRRWTNRATEFEDEIRHDLNPNIFDRVRQFIIGHKDSDTNWSSEVYNYMRDNLDVDIDDLEDEDPILEKAHNMILDQHETGILDTRTTAERVAKFVKDELNKRS